jgi:hypothetical protein
MRLQSASTFQIFEEPLQRSRSVISSFSLDQSNSQLCSAVSPKPAVVSGKRHIAWMLAHDILPGDFLKLHSDGSS